jgi:bacterial/archaeal transporter family-2 protein
MVGIIILGAVVALATGFAIGAQSTLSSRIGSLLGNFRTGIFINFIGGIIAGLILLVITFIQGKAWWQISTPALIMLVVSGALGIAIVTGISFSLQRTGVAAGLATVILGQLVLSVIVDTKGIGGVTPIPLTWQRVVGLVVVAGGVYLLLPRS